MRDVKFFIHQSRVKRLYRSFLKLASDGHERALIRGSFPRGAPSPSALVKEGEKTLATLRAAKSQVVAGEKPIGTGWPWERRR
jgi:hypothetical protein